MHPARTTLPPLLSAGALQSSLTREDVREELRHFLWNNFATEIKDLAQRVQCDIRDDIREFLEKQSAGQHAVTRLSSDASCVNSGSVDNLYTKCSRPSSPTSPKRLKESWHRQSEEEPGGCNLSNMVPLGGLNNEDDMRELRSTSTEARKPEGTLTPILPPADSTPADALNCMLDRSRVRKTSRDEQALRPHAVHPAPASLTSRKSSETSQSSIQATAAKRAAAYMGTSESSPYDPSSYASMSSNENMYDVAVGKQGATDPACGLLPGTFDCVAEAYSREELVKAPLRQEGCSNREKPALLSTQPAPDPAEVACNSQRTVKTEESSAAASAAGAGELISRRKSLLQRFKDQQKVWARTGFAQFHSFGTRRRSHGSTDRGSQIMRHSLDSNSFRSRHKLYQWLYMFVKSEYFDYLMGSCLIINALAIGVQADYMASRADEQVPPFFRVLMTFFCVVFVAELIARLSIYGRKFFYMRGWQWNWFDIVVVFFQIADEITTIALSDEGKMPEIIENLEVLRMLRVVRVVRLVRMVRLIPELKSMVYLISASMWSFFWTLVLLLLVMYVGAVYFTEISTELARKHPDNPDIVFIREQWGSIFRSVLSLYMAITGGDDWRNLTDVFKGFSYALNTFMFSIYIAFGTLVMLNLVTGVFVEGAQRIIKEDKDNDLMRQVCKLFMYNDADNSQEISWAEFEEHLNTDAMDEYFRAVELSRREAKDLFRLLDVDKSGSISIEEFVRGCLRLRGPARSVDLAFMQYHQQFMSNKINRIDSRLKEFVKSGGCASLCSSTSLPLQGYSGPPVDIEQAKAGY